jgi:PadR family transcriptional regulator PadR
MMEINEELITDKKFQKELNAGTTSLVLLSVLSQATGPMYGYQIAKQVENEKDDEGMLKLGTLYPVLRSLEKSGLLQSEVEPSVTGPPRRYYKITQAGRESLKRWSEMWDQTKGFIDSHLKGAK